MTTVDPAGRCNIVHEAVDRHAAGPEADTVAYRFLQPGAETVELTYAELAHRTDQVAAALSGLGLARGDVVATLLGRRPELYLSALGAMKAGLVYCPLFSAFGPEPIRQRLERGGARVLVTSSSLYRRRAAAVRAQLPGLAHVLLVDGPPQDDTQSWHELVDAAGATAPVETTTEDPALLHFTSGTTGTPKGALHVHGAVRWVSATATAALDLRPGDVYWCTADPGWVTGTSYGIVAPLVAGVTSVIDAGEFDAARWYGIVEEQGVSVWYTAPTAIRMLMRAGDEAAAACDLGSLRRVHSVGEPLNAEAVEWGRRVLGHPILDTWWQTETGGIMVANVSEAEVHPGSMGRPLPGLEAAVVAVDDDHEPRLDAAGAPVMVDGADQQGILAFRRGWPSMFRAYLHDDERYARAFRGDWYLSGDLVSRDADGWFWFVGRADDVIKTSGHLVGPFEVESALMAHPAVVEVGVVGLPDPTAGNVLEAFVCLRDGVEASEELRLELLGFARQRLGPAIAPRHITFETHLPHTRSGKIMRRMLRARALGLPEGDTSTLEPEPGAVAEDPTS